MKNMKKLLLTVFIAGFALSNISAMQNQESVTNEAEAPGAGELEALRAHNPILANIDYLATLPTQVILDEILPRAISNDLRRCTTPIELKYKIKEAYRWLLELRRISRYFYNMLTPENIVNTLIAAVAAGANFQVVTESGRNLIHIAAEDGNLNLLNILLAAGVNVNSKIKKTVHINPRARNVLIGATPLHIAVQNNRANIVAKLISLAKTDITAQIQNPRSNFNDWTALDFARRNNNLAIINMLEAAYLQRGLAIPPVRQAPQHHLAPGIQARRLDFSNL